MNKIILVFILTISLLSWPRDSISRDSRAFYLSYGDKIYELKTFKRAIIRSVDKSHQQNLSLILDDILLQSAKYDVDPILVVSTIWIESKFNKCRVSPVGARGAMQIMPKTGRDVFRKLLKRNGEVDLDNTSQNIELGVAYLSSLIKQFNGNEQHALISYNEGPRYVLKRKFKKFNHRYYNLIKEKFDLITKRLDQRGGYIKRADLENGIKEMVKFNIITEKKLADKNSHSEKQFLERY